ncbi:MAG: hypothetical protein H0U74_01135 [Bradymonadaceae bacterium]|nr:hypothetical protein [Lujinxingiaceae bacterium]
MKISRDFKEFIAFANKHDVHFLVVGGYAVAFHGHPRYTKDLDIWFERTPENVEKLLAALTDFGFQSLGLKASDFLEPEQLRGPARARSVTTTASASSTARARRSTNSSVLSLPSLRWDELTPTHRNGQWRSQSPR